LVLRTAGVKAVRGKAVTRAEFMLFRYVFMADRNAVWSADAIRPLTVTAADMAGQ
jgi:hypothetical protein